MALKGFSLQKIPKDPTGLLTKILNDTKWVAIDTETTISDFRAGQGTVRGISFAFERGGHVLSFYLPFGHYATPTFNENLTLADCFVNVQRILNEKKVIFHNAQFDLMILEYMGFNVNFCDFYDTMILTHLVDENNPPKYEGGKSLNACAKYYCNDPGKQKSQEFLDVVKYAGWNYLPASIMTPYASWDANMTYRLYWAIQPKLKQEDLGTVWKQKQSMIRLLIKMGKRGVRIDLDLARKMEQLGTEEMARISAEGLAGRNPGKRKDMENILWKELDLPVILHEKTGKPTFNKDAMAQYETLLEISAGESETAQCILEWRGWQKAVTAYYRPYQTKVSHDGRLRCNYKLHGTVTGRMSCEEPNLQQIPRVTDKPWNGGLKKCFIAEEGYELWEFDYSQLELRLATAFAKIPELLEIFADPTRDIFTEMSKRLGMTRPDTKTLVYAIQYGAGASHLSHVFRVSFGVAKERIDNFYAEYPRFKVLSRRATNAALRDGKLKLWSGRYRHFDDPKKQAHKAFNSFIQGGAADIVERQMVRLDAEGLNNEECRMLLQVHDSVVFEIATQRKDFYIPRIQRTMEDVKPNFGVVFKAEPHVWGE